MSLGRYSISNYSFWTGSEVQNEIDRFTREVTALSNTVNSNRNALISSGSSGAQFWTDWQVFLRDWNAYLAHRQRVGPALFGTSSTSAIVDLRQLVDRFNPLEDRYRSLTGRTASSTSEDSRQPSLWTSVQSAATSGPGLLAAAGLGVVGLVAVAVIAVQARSLLAPVRRNPRRRRKSR